MVAQKILILLVLVQLQIQQLHLLYNINMEEWKDIKGYEGLYSVSNLGRVKSIINNIILSSAINSKGYKTVVLFKNNNRLTHTIHRLVAKAFIPNPNNYICVNHKDNNRTNNSIKNLEWCTYSYNNSYNDVAKNRIKWKCISVIIYDIINKISFKYDSITNASKALNIPYHIIERYGHKHKIINNKYKVFL